MSETSTEEKIARQKLRDWGAMRRLRDQLVREGHAAGLTWREMGDLTGMGRATIGRILGPKSERNQKNRSVNT